MNGRETDLIMRLGSSAKKDAKEKLKKLYLEEFKSHRDYTAEELKEIAKAIKAINHNLNKAS